ncbi:MAG: uracil-DNA glycosylase [Verrucomicrobiota bacterium]|nr:uracil-DNA glycosylase [Verrucomicrobiota bacterium]
MNNSAGNSYVELLEATIKHLEDLREKGVKFVPVSQRTLTALFATAGLPRRAPAAQLPSQAAVPAQEAAVPAAKPAGMLIDTSAAPTDLEGKRAALDALRQRVLSCRKCLHLAQSRRNVVFGVGNPAARLMFVGEAPGTEEDEQGEPFVGKAGQLLTKIIQTMGLRREEVYIANILKCRPDTPGQATGNRKPTPTEMTTCLPHLLEQIKIIKPEIIVALGGTAVEGLFGKTQGITRVRGQWLEFQGVPVMPTYHPAYLLRNQSLQEKRKVWEDMMQVMERLGLPVTEKHRGYFLKG